MNDQTATAYEGAAAAWASGPARLYDRLAELIVDQAAFELTGKRVLDVGAGTGALARALARIGAHPTAMDSSADMLRLAAADGFPIVEGDMRAIPLEDASFDAAVAGFAISHVDAPERALAEMGRVVRPGGRVIAAVFAAAPRSASKQVVDAVAEEFGYVPPAWYVDLKTRLEPLTNTPEKLLGCAARAGLRDSHVEEQVADSGVSEPDTIVAARIGMAMFAPWVLGLESQRREAFLRRATEAVRRQGQPLRPAILVLSSRAPG